MEKEINSYPIHQQFTFYDPDQTPVCVELLTLIVTEKEGEILGCRFQLAVNHQVYQFIIGKSLFNLKPEVDFSVKKIEFLPEFPIEFQVELRPDWLLKLGQEGKTIENLVNYLMNLELPTELAQGYNFTENWYCLSVKQLQETGEVGYRTFWDYMNLSQMNEVVSTGSKIVESLSSFIKETSEKLTSQVETLNSSSEDFSPNLVQFIELLEKFGSNNSPQPQSISEVMREFFDEDDWNFVELEGESVLQMAFEGENGRYTCYACAFEESEQFVFYSLCPLAVPPEQTLPMAEYLMKVNYGLIVGNFELDFTDGEIRYKSSIDVEDEQLTTALVNNLVYGNVLTMDKYLPGITAIINAQISADEAIALVENLLENQTEQE